MHRARQIQGRRLGDLDGFLHGGQQAVPALPPQGGSETLRATDEQLDHNTGVLLHALAWYGNRIMGVRMEIRQKKYNIRTKQQGNEALS